MNPARSEIFTQPLEQGENTNVVAFTFMMMTLIPLIIDATTYLHVPQCLVGNELSKESDCEVKEQCSERDEAKAARLCTALQCNEWNSRNHLPKKSLNLAVTQAQLTSINDGENTRGRPGLCTVWRPEMWACGSLMSQNGRNP